MRATAPVAEPDLEEAPADRDGSHRSRVAGCADNTAAAEAEARVIRLPTGLPGDERRVRRTSTRLNSVRVTLAPTNTLSARPAPPAYADWNSDDVYGPSGLVRETPADFGAFRGGAVLEDGAYDALAEGLTPAEAAHRRAQLRFSAAGAGNLAGSAADRVHRSAQIKFYNAGVSRERRIETGGRVSSHRRSGHPHSRSKRRAAEPRRPAYWAGTKPIYR